ncbi:hypothetical protein LIER_29141 [Lithospermum erythrorhizon]|uniref:Hsp70-interacting protein N-terminal domain-containing protein n=1 Tax=Lithospermum erythrorhizon TaxID=34254 RepID=A0AAV3RI67_LITER
MSMEERNIEELKNIVQEYRTNPKLLHHPSLLFFKTFLQSFGAQIPPAPNGQEETYDILDEDIIESDVELDDTDVVEPDNDQPQQMGDSSIEVTEESQDSAQNLKSKAMHAISEGKLDEAIDYLTKAIILNPFSAMQYAARATVYIKLKKPNAAIRDADAALQINPDSAKGYKSRGLAKAMLGLCEEAASDLHVAAKLDYDEEIGLALKRVEPNVHKIEEHRRKYDRLRKTKELKTIEREKQWKKDQMQIKFVKISHLQTTDSARKVLKLLLLWRVVSFLDFPAPPIRIMSIFLLQNNGN